MEAPARDGAYIHGLFLEGAAWSDGAGALAESQPKRLFTSLPVLLVKAVPADKEPKEGVYQCPVYFTERRFREECFTAALRSKEAWTKWTTAGVAAFLDVA